MENRFIRIEDNEGNRYYPAASPDGYVQSKIIDSSKAFSGVSGTSTDGTLENDTYAYKGSVISLIINNTDHVDKTIFSANVTNIPSSELSITMRMKFTINQGATIPDTTKVIRVRVYSENPSEATPETLVTTKYLTKSELTFGSYATYKFNTEFSRVNSANSYLKIVIDTYLCTEGSSEYLKSLFDFVTIAMNTASSGGGVSGISVSGTTLVIA